MNGSEQLASLQKPYWYKLLTHFERKGYFQNGLTLPFIIGAQIATKINSNVFGVQELFREIVESGYLVSVLRCDFIGEYVFSIVSESEKDIYGGVGNLVIIDESFEGMRNEDEIVEFLSAHYTGTIESEKYSKIDGEWKPFNKLDLERIAEIL